MHLWYHVIKFNPTENSTVFMNSCQRIIEGLWKSAVPASNGCICCVPCNMSDKILKMDTINGTLELIAVEFPNEVYGFGDGILGLDGCIYYIAYFGHYVLKFCPEDNSLRSVGDELGDDHSRVACTFRLPRQPDLIIEHDPAHYMAYFEGGASQDQLRSGMGGALGRDGCVYAFLGVSATLVK